MKKKTSNFDFFSSSWQWISKNPSFGSSKGEKQQHLSQILWNSSCERQKVISFYVARKVSNCVSAIFKYVYTNFLVSSYFESTNDYDDFSMVYFWHDAFFPILPRNTRIEYRTYMGKCVSLLFDIRLHQNIKYFLKCVICVARVM